MSGGRALRAVAGAGVLVFFLSLLIWAGASSRSSADPPGRSAPAPSASILHADEDLDSDDTDAAHDHDSDGADDRDDDRDTDDPPDEAGEARAVTNGDCGGTATWRMEVERDDEELELELTFIPVGSGEIWSVQLSQNGTQFYAGQETTARSDDLEFERVATPSGTDTFTFDARRQSDQQACTGKVQI